MRMERIFFRTHSVSSGSYLEDAAELSSPEVQIPIAADGSITLTCKAWAARGSLALLQAH